MRNTCRSTQHSWKHDITWYCAKCGEEFKRVTFPKTITIANQFGKHAKTIVLRGTVKPGDKVVWHDGQVDEIVF